MFLHRSNLVWLRYEAYTLNLMCVTHLVRVCVLVAPASSPNARRCLSVCVGIHQLLWLPPCSAGVCNVYQSHCGRHGHFAYRAIRGRGDAWGSSPQAARDGCWPYMLRGNGPAGGFGGFVGCGPGAGVSQLCWL
jgi:hypothetical protein